MSTSNTILIISGSSRKDSFNTRLAHVAGEAVRAAGAEPIVTHIGEYPLPVFDQDFEEREGMPQPGQKLKALFVKSRALIFCCPEYNGSLAGPFKNTLDWMSRESIDGEPELNAYKGKFVQLLSASPGALGGMRGLVAMRLFLSTVGAIALPDQLCVSKAHEAFEPTGSLKDPKQLKQLQGHIDKLLKLAPQG